MPKKIIKTPTFVNTPGVIRVDFWDPDFSMLIDNKGYDAIWERALPCPCSKRQGAVLSNCMNCGGTGWVFINPLKIKVVASSINKDTKYKEWSQERIGTASFTVRPEYHLNFMDKITLENSSSRDSENRIVYFLENKFLISTIYPIGGIIDIFKFVSPSAPLQKIDSKDYEIQDRFVIFKNGVVTQGDSLTISYDHKVQYHILDLNHDVRNTIALDYSSREEHIQLPISAVGRRVHNVLDAKDLSGTNLFDNSYL